MIKEFRYKIFQIKEESDTNIYSDRLHKIIVISILLLSFVISLLLHIVFSIRINGHEEKTCGYSALDGCYHPIKYKEELFYPNPQFYKMCLELI
jgi:hypothetical protein